MPGPRNFGLMQLPEKNPMFFCCVGAMVVAK